MWEQELYFLTWLRKRCDSSISFKNRVFIGSTSFYIQGMADFCLHSSIFLLFLLFPLQCFAEFTLYLYSSHVYKLMIAIVYSHVVLKSSFFKHAQMFRVNTYHFCAYNCSGVSATTETPSIQCAAADMIGSVPVSQQL